MWVRRWVLWDGLGDWAVEEVLMRSRWLVRGLILICIAYGVSAFAFRDAAAPGLSLDASVDAPLFPPPGVAMATPEEMRSEVEVPALPRLPWSKEVMALEARDEFYNPIRTVPFLHHLLNNAEANNRCIKGESSFYGVDLEEIFDRLPSDQLKVEARQRSAELRGLIQESAQAAKDLEIEHWRQRFFDLHSAVESGHYVIIDYEPGSDDTVRGEQNAAALESLRLGRMNHDFLYITSTSRQKNDQRGPANAIIYVTRSTYPKSLELLDELRRLRTVARDVVWARLGVAAQPGVPFDGK